MPTVSVATVFMVAASTTVALAPCWLATTSRPARAGASGRAFSNTLLARAESNGGGRRSPGRVVPSGGGLPPDAHAAPATTRERTASVRDEIIGEVRFW